MLLNNKDILFRSFSLKNSGVVVLAGTGKTLVPQNNAQVLMAVSNNIVLQA